jgi:hypothetical protein
MTFDLCNDMAGNSKLLGQKAKGKRAAAAAAVSTATTPDLLRNLYITKSQLNDDLTAVNGDIYRRWKVTNTG